MIVVPLLILLVKLADKNAFSSAISIILPLTIVSLVIYAKNGVLDTGSYGDLLDRSWVFRTVGYGSDTALWKDMMSTLRMIGYEGSVSIEHEDGLMSVKQGLEKAIRFLQDVMITEQPAQMWWA